MRLQSNSSRPGTWEQKPDPARNAQDHSRHLRAAPGSRNRRSRRASATLTGAVLLATGVGAGIMFSDRLAHVWADWSAPSTAWMSLLSEKGLPTKAARGAKVESAVLTTPSAASLLQEQTRRPDVDSTATTAAVGYPTTTAAIGSASLSTPPIDGRELPWLPERELRADSAPPQTHPMTALARAATLSREVASTPAPVVPTPAASAPPAASLPPLAASSAPILSATEVADLIKRAGDRVQFGDIAGARLLLERAASGGGPDAMMALAETYDPAMLARWGARGIKADPGKARALYQKAADSGLAEARARVLALR